MNQRIFVTGGAGFIGSHTCIELLSNDYDVIAFDNLSNGFEENLRHVERITKKKLTFVNGDINDFDHLKFTMLKYKPASVIHFAGLKSVAESQEKPITYYTNNVSGSLSLLKAMTEVNCDKIIFSSSASVYGEANIVPFHEAQVTAPVSPYARSKAMIEEILRDWTKISPDNSAVILRYFNPIGAHASGLLGERYKQKPNNIMPVILEVAQKKRDYLNIYGCDYATSDGTGERDYIHVCDLAKGHLLSLQKFPKLKQFQILNLGTGKSSSVLELIHEFEKVSGISIPFKYTDRRVGDIAKAVADPSLAHNVIGFLCEKSLRDMCEDAWLSHQNIHNANENSNAT